MQKKIREPCEKSTDREILEEKDERQKSRKESGNK